MTGIEALALLILWTSGTFVVWWLLNRWSDQGGYDDDADDRT